MLDSAIARLLPAVPRPVVRRLSSRYIAGATLEQAVAVVRRLNAEGKSATVDVLGEEVADRTTAQAIADEYRRALARMDAEGLDANVSVKLSALGLELGEDECYANTEAVVEEAAAHGRFVRIDMEDSSTTDRTLALYRRLRGAGHENVGVVLQARLRRTLGDVAGCADVRLCKGIYVEPLKVAYREPETVRDNFIRILRALFEQGSFVGIATHDEALIERSLAVVREAGLGPDRYEFQMLLGVRPERGDELIDQGHRLRIYVPYGTRWYEYSLRRLQENPTIARYVAADTLARALGRR